MAAASQLEQQLVSYARLGNPHFNRPQVADLGQNDTKDSPEDVVSKAKEALKQAKSMKD